MKWTKQKLFAYGRKNGFAGKSPDEFVAWANDSGAVFEGLEKEADLKEALTKTVVITFDESDDVVIEPPAPADEPVTEAVDEEEDDDMMKRFQAFRASEKAAMRTLQGGGGSPVLRSSLDMPGHKAFGDLRSAKMLKYDRHVKSGKPLSRTKQSPVFGNAERMEAFNALVRLHTTGSYPYPQKSADMDIVTKNQSIGQNALGGALVFGEYFPELIENFSDYGAARQAAGVTTMREGTRTVSKLGEDITVGDIGEGDTMTPTNALFGNVTLNATKSYALAKVSAELLNDSAFSMEDILASSMMRSMRAWEDDCYFNGANNREGLADKIGANSTVDANLAARTTANWGGYEIADIQNLLGSLPAWASEDPNFGIACSWQFYMTVLRRFALSAGGNNGQMVLGGVAGPGLTSTWDWDGIPIYINNRAPKMYTADQTDAYAGAFSFATKFGVVTGSEEVAVSDQRYFEEDVWAIRMTQRWATNPHDVNNEALSASNDNGSGVVALKA